MKTRNLLSLLAIVIAIAFASTNLFAQEEKKEQKQGDENAVQTKTEQKNEGAETQIQNRLEVREEKGTLTRTNEGTMTREQLRSEEKALKGDGKKSEGKALKSFVDENGDGINDNAANSEGEKTALKQATKKGNVNKFDGNKYGPGDGTGKSNIGTKEGTYGPGTVTGSESGTKRGSRK